MELSELTQGDLLGVLAVPESEEQRVPGVVVLGGSAGGIPTQLAVALAERGFACLGLGYFGVAGLKPALAEIPVELVERAVDWLARNPRVSPGGVCLFGVSKGAELAPRGLVSSRQSQRRRRGRSEQRGVRGRRLHGR